jgi:predicted nucleotidyltransferase
MSDTDVVLARNISRDELLAELRALRPAFEREGVTHMALVGSRARRDNRQDSDVDLLIDVDSKRRFSLVEVARIMRAVEERTGLRADILMRRSLRPDFLAKAKQDELSVF